MKSRAIPAVFFVAFAVAATSRSDWIPPELTGTWSIDKAHSVVGFRIRHFVAHIEGRFTDFSGFVRLDAARPETSSVELTVKVASVDTYEPHRDAHLQEPDFFDARRFPEIRFVSRKFIRRSDTEWRVVGDLTMRGVTKEVAVPVTFEGIKPDNWERDRAIFEASLTLNRKDFGLNWSRLLDQGGYIMADEVVISIRIEATRPRPPATKPRSP
jgi:polyisoprenoid-binding protein YceI